MIDIIFVNTPEKALVSGNIISDISEHFSQFCILTSIVNQTEVESRKVRDFSKVSPGSFTADIHMYLKLIGMKFPIEIMPMLIEHSHFFITNSIKYSINTHHLKPYPKEE